MSDKLDIIIDLIKENRVELKNIREVQIEQHAQITRNADDLEEHIRRTNLLETKVDHLEAPLITARTIVKWSGMIGTIAGSIYGVGRLFGWF